MEKVTKWIVVPRVHPESEKLWQKDKYIQVGRRYEATLSETTVPPTTKQLWFVQVHDNYTITLSKDNFVFVDPPRRYSLHQSDIDTLWACPYKFALMKLLGLRPKDRPDYFVLGEMYHFALACLLHGRNRRTIFEKSKSNEMTLQWVRRKLQRTFDNEAMIDEAMKLVTGWMQTAYIARNYWGDNPPMIQTIDVELVLNYHHHDWPDDVEIGGTLDYVYTTRPFQFYIGEWKTAANVSTRYFHRLANSAQPAWYQVLLLMNAKHLFDMRGGEPDLRGIFYEAINKRTAQCSHEVVLLHPHRYRRGVQYIRDSIAKFQHHREACDWPRNLSACYGMYNTECPYMTWCKRNRPWDEPQEDLFGLYEIVDPAQQLQERTRPYIDYLFEDEDTKET